MAISHVHACMHDVANVAKSSKGVSVCTPHSLRITSAVVHTPPVHTKERDERDDLEEFFIVMQREKRTN